MSEILNATCEDGKVKIGTTLVPDALILSQGHGQSSGALFLDGPRKIYLTSNGSDIAESLEELETVLGKIAQALQDIGSNMTGNTTAPPPSLPGLVSDINAAASNLADLKGRLK